MNDRRPVRGWVAIEARLGSTPMPPMANLSLAKKKKLGVVCGAGIRSGAMNRRRGGSLPRNERIKGWV